MLAACRAAGVAERCIFSTMEFAALANLNAVARTSATLSAGRAWLPPGRRTPAVAMYHRSGARDATVRHDAVTPELVEAVHERDGRVYAWTVNSRRGSSACAPRASTASSPTIPACSIRPETAAMARPSAPCAIVGNQFRLPGVLSR